MLPIVSLLLFIALFALSFFVFMMIPFRRKKFKVIFISFLALFMVVMAFVPSSVICSIHLPIINSTIHDFAISFLEKSEDFRVINEFSGGLYDEIIPLIEDVVKTAFVFIFVAISLMLASIVSFIMHLFFKKKQLLKTSLFTTLTLVMSIIILLVPTFNVYILADEMKSQLSKEGEAIYETYPEYLEYKEIFDLIDKISIIETETIIDDIPLGVFSAYSGGSSELLINELRNINPMIDLLKETGITVIFEDPSFDFSMTRDGTFNYKKMDTLLHIVSKSPIYKGVALAFVNDVMGDLEKIVEAEFNFNKDIDLQFTSEELETQYLDLLNMLDFVVKHDLIRFLNLNQDELQNALDTVVGVLLDAPELVKIIEYPVLKKVTTGLVGRAIVAIKLCVRLYTAMNMWLEKYKATDMYQTASDFLKMKGVY